MARLFGTDGVRGEANVTLLPEMAYRLGRAATLYFGKEDEQPLILIGRDTRISGEMFEAALTAGICSAGGRAMLAGVIPTPAIAYLARRHKAKAGIVPADLHDYLPGIVTTTLAHALPQFGRKIPGFDAPDVPMTGIETRSSAPCRIRRDRATFVTERTPGIYPIGEGAGYAGGIMSAAVDGMKAALAYLSHE